MKITERNVQEIGSSLLITLPKSWTKALNIKKGHAIKLIESENGALTIAPEYTVQPEKKDVTFAYDAQFQRHFFREYFEGNETITVTFTAALSANERKALFAFLSRFMNVQVIAETNKKITLKCFKIDELTMEECLTRMHHLTVHMLHAPSNTQELRDTTTRFYYMLVMQIRRYLSEGKFTQGKQVPLIRAMDHRMVAEKMQRIAEAAMELAQFKKKPAVLADIIDTYQKTFSSYMASDFEKALGLWTRCNNLREKCRSAGNSDLDTVVRAVREISMLVR